MLQLKAKTQYLTDFFRHSSDIMIELDADLRWIAINPAGAKFFDCQADLSSPHSSTRLDYQCLLTAAQTRLAQAIGTGAQHCQQSQQPHSLQLTAATFDLPYTYDFAYTPILDESNTLVRIFAVGRALPTHDRPPQPLTLPLDWVAIATTTAPPSATPAIAIPHWQERLQFFEQILEDLPLGLFWKDQTLTYQWCNRTWAEIVGCDRPQALIGKTDADLPWLTAELERYREREQAVLTTGTPQLNLLTSRQLATGEQLWFNSHKLPTRNTQGQITGILCTFELIPEQQRASELNDSKELLQLVLDNIPQLLFWKDRNCMYLGCNRNWAKAAGLGEPEAVIGKLDADIWSPAEAELYRTQDEAVMASGVPVLHLVEQQEQVDKVAWIEVNKIPIRDSEGHVIGLLGTIEDITDRKQAEVALIASEAQIREKASTLQKTLQELRQTQMQLIQTEKLSGLGQLVAGVAHEINNPVNFIHGNITHAQNYTQDLIRLLELYQQHHPEPHVDIAEELEAIEIDFLKEDLAKLLKSMLMGTERIRKIVLSLRTFSRLDEAEVKDADIIDGIDSTLTILRGRLKATTDRPEIQVQQQYGAIPRVNCYAGQLNQVFMNILVNAIDALNERDERRSLADCQANPSTITITTDYLPDRDRIQIRIRDNGPGMPASVRERIFDPFYTTKAVGKGTGLGLSISYQVVVEKHGGRLICQSEPGQGTEFCIEIPVKNNILPV